MRTNQQIEDAIRSLKERREYAVEKRAIPNNTQVMQCLFDGMVEEIDVLLEVLEGRMNAARVYGKYSRDIDDNFFFAATLALEYMNGEIEFDKIKSAYLWE